MKTILMAVCAGMMSSGGWALDKPEVLAGATPAAPALAPQAPAPRAGGPGAPGNAIAPGAGRTPRLRPPKNDPAAAKKTAGDPDAAPADDADTPTGGASGKSTDLDNIEMKTGDKIYGKIHSELEDCVILMVNDNTGRIKVPKSKIKNLNFSMDTRLKALEPEDYAGQYKVGLWAMEKNMYPQAIELFESLKEKEGVSPDLLKQLGNAYQQRGQLDKALKAYEDYTLGNPEDAEAAATKMKLDKEVNPVVAEAAKPVAQKITEGLEADGTWFGEVWDVANHGDVKTTSDPQTGNKMIAVQSVGGIKDKVAFSRVWQPLNLSESSEMVFKIFNKSDTPINLAAAFVNARADFHETKQIKIPPKQWVTQSFKIEGKVFKSVRNEFKDWTLDLDGREHIGKITFLVYGQKGFTLYLDSLFFKEAKTN